ncbi:MAG: ABC transporter ATP-binding protein [Akkermansia sp.]|nr:ABC transporter ATP-binding protein [Akkermansia sp.]
MAYLEVREASVHFPMRNTWGTTGEVVKAVDSVNLNVERGKILGLVGESGCGKSTLSRAIMQLQPLTAGSISLDGTKLNELSAAAIRRRRLDFQMVFQDPYASLNPRFSIFSTLTEALSRRTPLPRNQREEAVAELMNRVGLSPEHMYKYPHEFSGGQRQRIAIARAIAPQPALLLADEPVSALDVSIQSQILNLLLDLRHDLGLTMIFISHDLSVVHYMADTIAVMQRGRIVEYGQADDVFSNPQHDYTRKLLAAAPKGIR